MNSSITQHFNRSEIPFLERCDDLVNRSLGEYRPVLTNFINPRQAYLLTVISNGYRDSHLKLMGGLKNAEMKRGLLYPDYFQPELSDFQLALINVGYPQKFVHLRHSQILGALMGSGIRRNTIGDIFTNGSKWQFLTEQKMVPFLKNELTRVGHDRVSLTQIALNQMISPINDWVNRDLTVSSLRVDVLIARSFSISRGNVKKIIKHGQVRLNWTECKHPDYELGPGDILSIRHFGRLQLKNLNGKSKKGKLRVVISIVKK